MRLASQTEGRKRGSVFSIFLPLSSHHVLDEMALLTDNLISFITWDGSGDFTTAVPETIMLAPAYEENAKITSTLHCKTYHIGTGVFFCLPFPGLVKLVYFLKIFFEVFILL